MNLELQSWEIINGRIINEFDEIVGTYRHIAGNLYRVVLYGGHYELTRKQLVNKVLFMNLYLEGE